MLNGHRPPGSTGFRSVPRLRKVIARLHPNDHARLEQVADQAGVSIEAMAAQMIVANLNSRVSS